MNVNQWKQTLNAHEYIIMDVLLCDAIFIFILYNFSPVNLAWYICFAIDLDIFLFGMIIMTAFVHGRCYISCNNYTTCSWNRENYVREIMWEIDRSNDKREHSPFEWRNIDVVSSLAAVQFESTSKQSMISSCFSTQFDRKRGFPDGRNKPSKPQIKRSVIVSWPKIH